MHHDDPELPLKVRLKRELRRRRVPLRQAMKASSRQDRSRLIGERVTQLPVWSQAKCVLAFVSMPSEVQTQPLVDAARKAGKQVCAPVLAPGSPDLSLSVWDPDADLVESPLGFRMPPPSAPTVADTQVDLVLVPALAIDQSGYRLGYGKGYYDRLLPRLSRAFRVGLVFDFELMTELPRTPWDVPVHAVVTDTRTLRVGAPGAP